LPDWYEWELAAAADEKSADARSSPTWRARILDWYAQPGGQPLPQVGSGAPDIHGVQDLNGLIWEWVEDFNSLMVSGDSRTQGDPDKLAFCGSGALSAQDRENYPVLMRLAFLSSQEARSTVRILGFRCASAAAPPRRGFAAEDDGARLPTDSLYQLQVPLQSSDGTAMTLASLRGKPLLVTLFYNNCTSVCPMLTAQLQNIERQLAPKTRGNITILMVSLDPTHDTAQALQRFKREHHVDGPNWVVARADAADVRVLAAALGIQYRELPDHSFNHSTVITLADRDGRVAARSVGPRAVDTVFLRRVRAIVGSMAGSGATSRPGHG
jgi:cytochrome oxidase Cu insertion factor (SCO1/SenC/PrrC family)